MTITAYFRQLERALKTYCSGELRAYPTFEAATRRSGSFSFEAEYWDNSRKMDLAHLDRAKP